MISLQRSALTLLAGVFCAALAPAIQHDMPPGMTHEQHLAQMKKQEEMNKRGNVAMGFDQDKTTHHFWLTPDGGIIQVGCNDTSDTESRDLVRAHFKKIAQQFTEGDFSAPFATHAETPPGVPEMQRLKGEIRYSFEEQPQGAAVRISSANKQAVKAVHDFLRYQIREHDTGDPMEVTKK